LLWHQAVAARPLAAFAIIQGYPFASFRRSPAFKQFADRHRDNLSAFVSDDPDLIRTRPQHSDFVAYVPRFVLRDDLYEGRLVEVPLRDTRIFDCWMLATARGWSMPVVRRLAGMARSRFA